MSDLIDDPRLGENAPEFTVSEISGAVKRTLEAEFGRIRVKGEVGRVVQARSGHMYFDVKDERNALACTTWKGQVSKLSVLPEEGMEVVVSGKMTSFGGQSKYNLNVDDVAVAGVGALMAMLEKRKTALAAEGLFDPALQTGFAFFARRDWGRHLSHWRCDSRYFAPPARPFPAESLGLAGCGARGQLRRRSGARDCWVQCHDPGWGSAEARFADRGARRGLH